MTVSNVYAAAGLSIESLLLHAKGLAPLGEAALADLNQIQALVLDDAWTEADVRANVIDPIVRLLGYKKGEVFSVDRERKLDFLDVRLFIDYAVTLWQENFWLIEAKRPDAKRDRFGQKDLDQALRYAVHPDVNAALVVLSDGNVFEVFDREVSVAEPVLRVVRSQLAHDFDKLRALLEPWQTWFFQKRRVIRLIDKVFDREFNLGRVNEVRDLVDRRLNGKRPTVLHNYRANISVANDTEAHRLYLQNADTVELVDVHLFHPQPWPDLGTITNTLITRSEPGGFSLLYKLFPDDPRYANDIFWWHALYILMTMETRGFVPNWAPPFLGGAPAGPRTLTQATENLIALCLTCFEADEGRKIILLFAAAIRRVFKVLSLIDPALADAARTRHYVQRYMGDELSFSQSISSPDLHLLHQLDELVLGSTANFVQSCTDERRHFRSEEAKQQVRRLWALELALLESTPNYHKLLIERNLGEGRMTEASYVSWDALAYNALCFIARFDRWRDHVLERHSTIVSEFATMGYQSARDLLGIPHTEPAEPATNGWTASRFFFDDEVIARRLRKAYEP